MRERHGKHKPASGHQRTGANHVHLPEAHHETIRDKSPHRHRAERRRVADPHQIFVRTHDLLKIHAAPIIHHALAAHIYKANHAEQKNERIPQHEFSVFPRGNVFRNGFLLRSVRRNRATNDENHHDHARRINADKMLDRRNSVRGERRRDQPREKSRQAPHAVKTRHDAPPVKPLHAYALRVDRDVVQVSANSEKHQRRKKRRARTRSRRKRNQRQRKSVNADRNSRAGATADARRQPTRKRHCNKLPERNRKKHAPELRFAHAERRFDVGNAARPTAEHDSLHKIKRAHDQPKTLQARRGNGGDFGVPAAGDSSLFFGNGGIAFLPRKRTLNVEHKSAEKKKRRKFFSLRKKQSRQEAKVENC